MPVQPCIHSVTCADCYDPPLLNLSAEAADRNEFFALAYSAFPPPIGVFFHARGCLHDCRSPISQEDANQCAASQALLCDVDAGNPPPPGDGQPPGGNNNGGGGSGTGGNWQPQRAIFYNDEQTCGYPCPNGDTFTHTVPAGTVPSAISREHANALALALCQKQVRLRVFCFGATMPPGCSGSFYDFIFPLSGGRPPYAIQMNYATAPNGLFLDTTTRELSGTPTTPGLYNVEMSATDSNTPPSTIHHTFQLYIVEITNSSLADAYVGTPYSDTLVCYPPSLPNQVWSISAGTLPTGLTLNPVTGAISGTPTVSGTASFTVRLSSIYPSLVTVCQKAFTLAVATNLTPCDLSLPDNTLMGNVTPDSQNAGTTADAFLTAGLGQYEWRYIGGAHKDDTNPCAFTWKALSSHAYYNNADSGTELLFNLSYCGANQAAVEANAFMDPTVALQFLHTGGQLGARLHKVAGVPPNYTAGSPQDETWSIRRVIQPAFTPSASLALSAASWAALGPLLVPLTGAAPGGLAPVYDGRFPNLTVPVMANSWYWNYTPGTVQHAGALLSFVEVYHTTFEPLSPTGCAWICDFYFSTGGAWSGMGGGGGSGGGGLLPTGRYFFNTGLSSSTVAGGLAAVRVATTTALPANTRVGNVITANAVGTLPAIDGVTLNTGDRVLLKNETPAVNNGCYVVNNVGSPADFFRLTRATDFDTSPEVLQGLFFPVTLGATLGGTYWRLTTLDPITLNTTPLTFQQIPPYIDIVAV